jgi:hypothetical protein
MRMHEIIIHNFKPNETVYYDLIIIKGAIRDKQKSTCRESRTDEKIYLELDSTNLSFKLVDGKFKALVELKSLQNSITLKYCCSIITLDINYSPRATFFSVLPLYIICEGHDGKFQSPPNESNDVGNALRRITLGAKLLQSVVAEKLYEEKQGRKTFRLEDSCRVFRSSLNYLKARKMTQEELWTSLGREIVNSDLGHERIKFLSFLSCTKYCGENCEDNFTHDDIVKLTQAHVALGGGGLALFGTACLYTWPEKLSEVVEKFEDSTTVDRKKFMDDSCYRGTWGACFSTTLGAVLHELCHTFDLGHTQKGIMGRGFDDICKVFLCNKQTSPGKMYQNSIKFDEKFESNLTAARKTCSIQSENAKDQDDTFWTRSCLIFLAHHKWFNNTKPGNKKIIKFEPASRVVKSTDGLRVIELRNEDNGMVLLSWTFEGKILKYSFQLPEDDLGELRYHSVMMFVEDNAGNIFKHLVNI